MACWRGTDFLDNHSSTKEAFTSNTEKVEIFPYRETETPFSGSLSPLWFASAPPLSQIRAARPFLILLNQPYCQRQPEDGCSNACQQGISCRSWMPAEQDQARVFLNLPAATPCCQNGPGELSCIRQGRPEDATSSRDQSRSWRLQKKKLVKRG